MGIFDGYLLASDMDGTLLNSKGKLSEENKKAIEYFVDNGGQFTLATGRMLPSVKRHIHKMKVTLPVILYNGTKVYDFNNNEVIWEKSLEEYRKEVINVVSQINQNVGIEIYSEEVVYIYRACRQTERFINLGYDIVYEVDNSIYDKLWTKVLIVGEREELDFVEKYLKETYGDRDIVRSSSTYLEIIPKKVSKGQALKELIRAKGIEKCKVITAGDNMNDVELLDVAHYGFCIGNGSEVLKEKAKYIAPSNDEHAIEFIVSWIEKRLNK